MSLDLSTRQDFDIVIVGGGMVGVTLALALAQLSESYNKPLSIALIETNVMTQSHSGFDARVIALAQASVKQLIDWQIWPQLATLATPIQQIHVSDRGHLGMAHLDADAFNVSALGQVIELNSAGRQLYQYLAAKKNVTLFCPSKIMRIDTNLKGHLLSLDDGNQISTSLLVAADGRDSYVRQCFRMPVEKVSYHQSALITNVGVTHAKPNVAFERFTEYGPMALLPMKPVDGVHHMSLVWAQSNEQARLTQQLSDTHFLSKLQQEFGYRAGIFVTSGQRHIYPLDASFMVRPIWHRCVFIGNAAQQLHPIAGQGFNLALRDVIDLIACIDRQLKENLDIGNNQMLHAYLKLRESDRQRVITGLDSLVRGFSNNLPPAILARNLGLRLLEFLPPIKNKLGRLAMGWR